MLRNVSSFSSGCFPLRVIKTAASWSPAWGGVRAASSEPVGRASWQRWKLLEECEMCSLVSWLDLEFDGQHWEDLQRAEGNCFRALLTKAGTRDVTSSFAAFSVFPAGRLSPWCFALCCVTSDSQQGLGTWLSREALFFHGGLLATTRAPCSEVGPLPWSRLWLVAAGAS